MDRKGFGEAVRDGLGCAVVVAVLGIGGAVVVAGVAAHGYGARKDGGRKKNSIEITREVGRVADASW
jgi:hypothetical protein